MCLRISKSGLLDTIQDAGRYGYQHLGINPGGAMDTTAMQIANALVGNDQNEAIIEMHFPAAEIVFEEPVLIALSGADFGADINGESVPVLHPVIVQKGTVLKFKKNHNGARVYLAVHGGYRLTDWLHSYSTHLKVKAGGFEGRPLQKNDRLFFKKSQNYSSPNTDQLCKVLHWTVNAASLYMAGNIHIVPGAEYHALDSKSRQRLETASFHILQQSDRMGYRLQGESIASSSQKEMISTAVTRGTIQLLPDGQLIILMADHQTTGGYPRVGHVVSANLPALAQKKAGDKISFQKIDLSEAEEILFTQERNLLQLQNACNFRLQEYFGQ